MFRFVVEICFVFLQLNERVQCSQSLSVPAYRLVDVFQTDTIDNISTVFCPTSIVFQSIESISIFNAMNFKQIEIFLFENERRSIGSPIKNGSTWILNKPDPSLCYSIVFTKTNPTENLNVDQINVSFLYDFQPTNNETILRLTQTDSSSTGFLFVVETKSICVFFSFFRKSKFAARQFVETAVFVQREISAACLVNAILRTCG